jgi:hypothetical protein
MAARKHREKMPVLQGFLLYPFIINLSPSLWDVLAHLQVARPSLVNPLWEPLTDTPRVVPYYVLGASQVNQVDNQD